MLRTVFSWGRKARVTRDATACTTLAMNQTGKTTSASVFVIHSKQSIDRRPVGADPAAKINSNQTTRNIAKTAAARLRPTLSSQLRLFRRCVWSKLFGNMGTNPGSRTNNATARLWFRRLLQPGWPGPCLSSYFVAVVQHSVRIPRFNKVTSPPNQGVRYGQ